MNKTIGILAHVDAGKTTFSEQLLYHTNSIRQRGRVDHKNSFLDSHEIEKKRGITVFSDQAVMYYKDSVYYLIDTPGHVDFSSEMERSIKVMDYAIIIVSGVEGVEGHTETVWNLLRKHNIPTFFFINKVDRDIADTEKVLDDIRKNLSLDAFDITDSFNNYEMNEELREFLAERDEQLFEKYIEGSYDKDFWLKAMISLIRKNRFFPCCRGSALQDTGIIEFLDKFDKLTITDYIDEESFSGRAYKITHDENGMRLTFIKALKGNLKVRDELTYNNSENKINEKITQIRIYNGNKFTTADKISAGQLFAVTGLSKVSAGDGVGDLEDKAVYEMVPALRSKVVFSPEKDVREVLRIFKILEAEDPALNVIWEEKLQEINIHVMGIVQLEILQQIVKDRFAVDIEFENPQILYKETINNSVTGHGHFEPLRHYAEVHLKLEPGNRNEGITFENTCHTDDLSKGNQNLIAQHIFEKEHHGLLTGSPLTDVKVTLLTGRSHIKHTSGGDFREATFRALRQGLEKAENILLEPWYKFRIKVNLNHMGRVLSDIQKAYGEFESPLTEGDKALITGKAPVATFMNYSSQLASFSQGNGSISMVFNGYYPCHNSEEIIEKIGYDKNADPEYSSSSVFCSKGQGFTVPWDEVEGKMHCL